MSFSFRSFLTLSIQIFLCLSLCFSFLPSVRVKPRFFLPPSTLHVQTTEISFSLSFLPLLLEPHCPQLFSSFVISDFFSSAPTSYSPQPAHLRNQQSTLVLISQTPIFWAIQQHRHYQGVIIYSFILAPMDMLSSLHIFRRHCYRVARNDRNVDDNKLYCKPIWHSDWRQKLQATLDSYIPSCPGLV